MSELHKAHQPECCKKLRDAGWSFGYSDDCKFVYAEHPLGGRASIVEVVLVCRNGFDYNEIGRAIANLLNGGESCKP